VGKFGLGLLSHDVGGVETGVNRQRQSSARRQRTRRGAEEATKIRDVSVAIAGMTASIAVLSAITVLSGVAL
jgi:hypothetical protein